MAELSNADYDAVVLRFFQNQHLRMVGHALGVSDGAAQKRVARALEKLREQLGRRGLTTTAAALSLAITANAVHAAPAGLMLTISAAAAMTGSAAAATTTATITKTIALTMADRTRVSAECGVRTAEQAFPPEDEPQPVSTAASSAAMCRTAPPYQHRTIAQASQSWDRSR
jgi:hypothetical protein